MSFKPAGERLPADHRKKEVRSLFETMVAGESISIVGVGSGGKSNLLRLLARDDVQENHLDKLRVNFVTVYLDAHKLIDLQGEPLQQVGDSWVGFELMLDSLRHEVGKLSHKGLLPPVGGDLGQTDADLSAQIDKYYKAMFSSNPLMAQAGLRHLDRVVSEVLSVGHNWKIVFLFDEMEEFFVRLPVAFFQNLRGLRDDFKQRVLFITTSRVTLGNLVEQMAETQEDASGFKTGYLYYSSAKETLMIDESSLLFGAKQIVQYCLGLKQNQNLVIFLDETTIDLGMLLMEAAAQLSVFPTSLFVPIDQQTRIRSKNDLSLPVQEAVKEARAILTCVNALPDCLPFRELILETQWSARTRIGHMPGATLDILKLADVDFEKLISDCQNIGQAMARGRSLELLSSTVGGRQHRLTIDMDGLEHLPVASDGVIGDGVWGNVPSGETYIVPVEGKSEGEVVINGSIPDLVIDPSDEMVLYFEAGQLVHIEPAESKAAQWLKETQIQKAKSQGDRNWANLAEIGVGVNPGVSHLTGKMLFDEKAAGTAHVALGSSTYLGGNVASAIHCDMVIKESTVTIDGKKILDRGKLCFAESEWRENYTDVLLRTSPLQSVQGVVRSGVQADTAGGRLQRILRSEPGRLLFCYVGDDETARLAYELYRLLPNAGTAVSIEELAEQAQMSPETARRVLHLMWDYGLVSIV